MEDKCYICGRSNEQIRQRFELEIHERTDDETAKLRKTLAAIPERLPRSWSEKAEHLSGLAKQLLDLTPEQIRNRRGELREKYVGVDELIGFIDDVDQHPDILQRTTRRPNSVRGYIDSVVHYEEIASQKEVLEKRIEDKLVSMAKRYDNFLVEYRASPFNAPLQICTVCEGVIRQIVTPIIPTEF